jgi:hypothetical protein
MFAFRSNRQPEMSLDAELFLESERARMHAEMQGIETTPNRDIIEEPINSLRQATIHLMENRDDHSLVRAVVSSVLAQTMMAFNTIQEVAPRHLARERQAPYRRVEDDPFLLTCQGLGSFLLHGIQVARWNKNQDRTNITGENRVALTLNGIAEMQFGGRRNLRRFAKALLRAS